MNWLYASNSKTKICKPAGILWNTIGCATFVWDQDIIEAGVNPESSVHVEVINDTTGSFTTPQEETSGTLTIAQNGYCSRDIYLQFEMFARSVIYYVYYSKTIRQNLVHWLARTRTIFHREYCRAHHRGVGGANKQWTRALLSLLFHKIRSMNTQNSLVYNVWLMLKTWFAVISLNRTLF